MFRTSKQLTWPSVIGSVVDPPESFESWPSIPVGTNALAQFGLSGGCDATLVCGG